MPRSFLRWRNLTVRVTSEQKAALARALQSRYRKLREGTFYNAGGDRPKDFTEGISIDLGLILIGLTECLGSKRAAEDTLKDVITVFLGPFDARGSDRRLIEAKRFNLDRQFQMMRAWQASGADGRLEGALSIGARLLFGAEADAARVAKLLIRDARPIYDRTLRVFGRTVPLDPLASGDLQRPSAEAVDHSPTRAG
jgi:hypothetical protein